MRSGFPLNNNNFHDLRLRFVTYYVQENYIYAGIRVSVISTVEAVYVIQRVAVG